MRQIGRPHLRLEFGDLSGSRERGRHGLLHEGFEAFNRFSVITGSNQIGQLQRVLMVITALDTLGIRDGFLKTQAKPFLQKGSLDANVLVVKI